MPCVGKELYCTLRFDAGLVALESVSPGKGYLLWHAKVLYIT